MQSNYITANNKKISEIELFFISIVLGFWFLNFEAFIRLENLYKYLPDVDIPSHLFSGLALGLGFYWIFTLISKKRSIYLPILFTFIAAVSWEIAEYIEDWVVPQAAFYLDYFFWDGFFDIIFTTLGSVMVLSLVNANFSMSKWKKLDNFIKKYISFRLHNKLNKHA